MQYFYKVSIKNVHDAVMCILNKFNLQLTKLCGLTTDGAPSMIGKNTEFTIILKKTVADEIITSHYILHTEQHLCQNFEYETRYAKFHFNS